MRVHPSSTGSIGKVAQRWQYPVAIGLVLLLLVVTAVRSRAPVAPVQPQQPAVKMIDVVVSTKPIEAGQPFDKGSLVIEQRPVNSLPSDVITSFEILNDKVSAGPIPAGYPLSRAFLAEAVPVLSASSEQEDVLKEIDPFDTILERISKDTVAVSIELNSTAPERGKRVALAVLGQDNKALIIVDEAWVTESNPRGAVVRVGADKALTLQSVSTSNRLVAFEISPEGDSPYKNLLVTDMDQIDIALGRKTNNNNQKPTQSNKERKFKGYAWTPKGDQRFGIDQDGNMYRVDEHGKEISPTGPGSGMTDSSNQ